MQRHTGGASGRSWPAMQTGGRLLSQTFAVKFSKHTHTHTLLANKAILGIALGTPVLMHWLQVVANQESFFFHKHLQQTSGAGKQDHSWHCPPSLGTSVMHLLQVACTKSSCEPDAGGPYTRNIRASFRRPLAPNCSFAHQTCGQKVAVGHISPSGGVQHCCVHFCLGRNFFGLLCWLVRISIGSVNVSQGGKQCNNF